MEDETLTLRRNPAVSVSVPSDVVLFMYTRHRTRTGLTLDIIVIVIIVVFVVNLRRPVLQTRLEENILQDFSFFSFFFFDVGCSWDRVPFLFQHGPDLSRGARGTKKRRPAFSFLSPFGALCFSPRIPFLKTAPPPQRRRARALLCQLVEKKKKWGGEGGASVEMLWDTDVCSLVSVSLCRRPHAPFLFLLLSLPTFQKKKKKRRRKRTSYIPALEKC